MNQIDLTEREKLDAEVLAIALKSLAAGEALEPIAETRGVAAALVPYRYGMHIGNWTDGNSDGLLREVEATLPESLLFMDNVKPEAIDRLNAPLAAAGVKPLWIYRPYFNPEGGATGANIQNYANTVRVRVTEYLLSPVALAAYNEGRFVVKIFNETNIGGEGFARGRAGFAPALAAWKTVRSIVKGMFPLLKVMSIANTPGNDDVWFTGDAPSLPYWYHGPQAAKANPTQADILMAVASCPFREMFELCDYIGIHVYAQDERQTRGDLQTWYSRRHEQALKFLRVYTDLGKKLIISECDCGYDQAPNPQAARAELFVWWLANVVGPNAAILTVNHWWNSDDQEGAGTWEKHQTRKGGEFRPVVHAVKAFREGATVPPPEGPPPPEPPPVPPPGDDIRLPEWCNVVRATVPVGGLYWHLKRAYWQDSDTSGGTRHIYALQPHSPAQGMLVTNGVETWRIALDKPWNEPAGNHAMWAGNVYTAGMDARSDKVEGMKMPFNQHVSYFLEWELRVREGGFMIDRRYRSPNHEPRPAGMIINTVVLHHTGGDFGPSLNWLMNPASGVSTHYLIDRDGSIYELVEEGREAWHAGYSLHKGRENVNDFSIGIELVNDGDGVEPYPQRLQDALVWLLNDIKSRRGVIRSDVVTHKAIRDAWKLKYPNTPNVGTKTDPRGLNVEAILNRVYPPPPPPVEPRWDKIVWSIEQAARILQAEGWSQEHDIVLSDISYVDAVRERDN